MGGGGGGATVGDFFTKNPNLKSKNNFWGGGERGDRGTDVKTNRPKSICPFNFFEVGGITMHKCTSNVPDKLKLLLFYHLTFKCDLDRQPT